MKWIPNLKNSAKILSHPANFCLVLLVLVQIDMDMSQLFFDGPKISNYYWIFTFSKKNLSKSIWTDQNCLEGQGIYDFLLISSDVSGPVFDSGIHKASSLLWHYIQFYLFGPSPKCDWNFMAKNFKIHAKRSCSKYVGDILLR